MGMSDPNLPEPLKGPPGERVAQVVEQLLLESIDEPSTEWTAKDVEDIRRAGLRLIERRKQSQMWRS
jgi:hypothetical protein